MNKKIKKRIIAHLDMDAFFASVEERDNPKLKGMPIVVGSDPKEGIGRGVVSTANYKARKYGIYSALPISIAWRLSEDAKRKGNAAVIFLSSDFNKYTRSSNNMIEIIKKYSKKIEKASIDEAYFDLSFLRNCREIETTCKKIKNDIQGKEKLTCSIGVGPNKLIAKLASDYEKPDGLTIISEKDVENFLETMSVRKIPGIGPKTEEKLLKINIKTVKDIKKISKERLYELFGKWGVDLYEKARGRDNSDIVEVYEAKSIGEQETFENDSLDFQFIYDRFDCMVGNVIRRLLKEGFLGFKTVVITIRFSDFETKTRSHTLKAGTNSLKILKFKIVKLLMPFFDKRENPRRKLIRMIGLRIEKLEK